MKKPLLLLFVFILFNCTAEDITKIARDLTLEKNHKIGLVTLCNSSANLNWICVSKSDFDKLKVLPKSCEVVTITSSSGNNYSGIINSFSNDEKPCSK